MENNEPKRESIKNESNTFLKKYWWMIALLGIIILSFVLYMISLSIFPISYGPDGPYYDIHVREVLRTGIPDTSDPPLIYYYLAPFVLLFGNSYLGIKVGMALIASLMAIPSYLLTRIFIQRIDIESKIPALLAAFLITINVYSYRMIEDFMKNLFGTFFLLFFMYYLVKWFEDLRKWKKNGVLMGFFFICTFFSHVYPGLVAAILLIGVFFFNLIIKWIKTKKLPKTELLLLFITGLFSLGIIILLLIIYPSTIENIYNRLTSYLNGFISGVSEGTFEKYSNTIANLIVYLNIPYILGLFVAFMHLYKGLKKQTDSRTKLVISRKTFLAWLYIIIAILLIAVMLVPTSWSDRFILLAFVPLSLIPPLFLLKLSSFLRDRYETRSNLRYLVIGGISIIFAMMSLINVVNFWKTMGPSITMKQYDELQTIHINHVDTGNINSSGIINVDHYHFGYWVEYIMDMEVFTGNATTKAPNYVGREIYGIYIIMMVPPPFRAPRQYPWNPFLPLSFPETVEKVSYDGLKVSQPTPPPAYGIPIHIGIYYEVRLLYYANGTQA